MQKWLCRKAEDCGEEKNNGVEILGFGTQSASGSVSLEQEKGHVCDFDNWKGGRSKYTFKGMQGS